MIASGLSTASPPPYKLAPPLIAAPPPEEAPEAVAEEVAKKKKLVMVVAGIAAVVVLGGAGYFGYQQFLAPEPPPPPPAVKPKAAAPKTTPQAKSGPAPLTPSETLNNLAQVPGKAVTKAQEALDARRAAGQSRIDSALTGEDPATKAPASPAPGSAGKTATGVTTLQKGLTATTTLEFAAPEASVEFRSFVASAKVSGVFQGTPARAMINGRLVRSGETVDAGLGIRFDGVDSAKRHLVFKDRNGAVVVRKY